MVTKRPKKQVSSGHKKDHEIYECPKCKSMVFNGERLHSYICHEYRKRPALVEGTHKAFKEIWPVEAEEFYAAKNRKN